MRRMCNYSKLLQLVKQFILVPAVRVQSWVRVADFISCRTSSVWKWIFFSSLRLSENRNPAEAENVSLLWGFCIPSLLEVSIPDLYAFDNAKDVNLTTIRKVRKRLDMNVFHYLSCWTSGEWKHYHRIYIADNDRRRHLSMVTTVSCWF